VDYLILSLGADGRQVAIPWSAVNPNMIMELPEDETSYHFSLQTDQGVVEAAPDFQISDVPPAGEDNPSWDAQLRVYWDMGEAPDSMATGTPTASAEITATVDATAASTSAATALPSTPLNGTMLLSQLIGMGVQTSDGQSAGAIEEVLINSSGAAAFVVLSTTNEDGEAALVAVPLHALGWNEGFNGFVLHVDKATLDSAPDFAGGEYPTTEAGGWDAEVSSYWAGY
jgi:hypothetical protein